MTKYYIVYFDDNMQILSIDSYDNQEDWNKVIEDNINNVQYCNQMRHCATSFQQRIEI